MKKRLLACLLTAAMLVSLFPLPALAAEAERPEWMVTAFDPLDGDIAAQTVPQGGEPVLPDSLTAWAYAIEDDTAVIPPPEGLEQESEQPQADGAEEPADRQEPDIQPVTIPGVTWEAQPEFDPDAPGEYVYTPVLLAAYAVAEGVELPAITVTVKAVEPEQTALQRVQALIDALPSPEDITANNRAEVEEQLAAIDAARLGLTDEEAELLDNARYQAVVSALAALDGQAGNDLPMPVDGETGNFTVTGGELNADYKYENNTLTILTGKALTISGKSSQDRIFVEENVAANLTIKDLTISVGNYSNAMILGTGANVTLALEGTNSLTSGRDCAGIRVPVGATLTIKGDGSLAAKGNDSMSSGAGIGGNVNEGYGSITIEEGTVTATAKGGAAGIGGGGQWYSSAQCEYGTVTITGGIVKATGGVGIGGSYGNTDNTFSTGTSGHAVIMASSISDRDDTDSWSGVFFLKSNNGQVYGEPTIQMDVEISENQTLTIPDGAKLTIANGKKLTNNGSLCVAQGTKVDGTIQNNGVIYTYNADSIPPDTGGEVIVLGSDKNICGGFYVVGDNTAFEYTVTDGGTLTIIRDSPLTISNVNPNEPTPDNIAVAAGVQANITLAGVHIKTDGKTLGKASPLHMADAGDSVITLQEGAVNVLDGKSTRDVGPGIYAPENNKLTIRGPGSLEATGGTFAAGIGSKLDGEGFDIRIEGGTITARPGGSYGSGLGKGYQGKGGTITITGGVINASPIDGDTVTISGGFIDGWQIKGTFSTTSIDGETGNAVIRATIGDKTNQKDWSGVIFERNCAGKVYGTNVTPTEDFTVMPSWVDETLEIPEGAALTIDNGVTLTNNGTIIIEQGGTLQINETGKLVNNGTITNNSTSQGITGNGAIEGSGTLTGSGTLADTVKYQRQSSVTISFEGNDVTGGNFVPYGSTITIKATAAKAAANGLNRAAANQMEFFVGTGGSKRSLGTAGVDRNGTASLQITLSGTDWGKGFQIGGNTITAEYGGSDYLAGATGTATLTVNKLTPTAGNFTFNAPANLTYSGTAKEASVTSTATGMGKITVHYFDEAGKAVDKPENAGTYTVKIDVAEGENYAAASGLTDEGWTFIIAKAPSPASVTKPLNIANHLERTYTFALSYLRPAIAGGWGEVSYEFTASFTKSGYYTSGAEITPGPSGVPNTLTLPIQFNDTTDEGTVGTVTVTLHSQNYGDYTGTINIVAHNKTAVTFSGVEGVTTPYTGQSVKGYKGTLAVTTQNGEPVNVNDLTLEISYTGRLDTSYESTQPPTDVGTYFVVFRAADTDEHYIGREHFAFEITKATPTGAPKYTAITTSGKTLADAALTTAGGTFSVLGTVAWELDETTAVEANTAYKWIFTPTDTHNYTTLEGSVTLWQRSSGGNTGGSTGGSTGDSTGGNSGGGGGGGGGSYTPTYPPTVEKPSEGGGTPTVTPSNPKPGDTVTVTPKPDEGYEVDKITVTDKNGKPVEVTKKPDGTYTFRQPSGQVTIEIEYAPVPLTDLPWNNPFTDVSEGDWYYEAVRFVQERGLMNGYEDGRFGPNDTLSRAQLAQILFNKEGRPGVDYLLDFSDVAGEAWYTEAIRWAASQGIVSGYGNGTFGPNNPITREQLAVMLWRYSGSPAATSKELHFADADEISGFALEALRWAVENGILNGYGDGRLGPQGQATRAQVAQMLKNFIENQEENA